MGNDDLIAKVDDACFILNDRIARHTAFMRETFTRKPIRKIVRHIFLEEFLAADPIGKPKHGDQPILYVGQHQRRYVSIVFNKLSFRNPRIKLLLWVRYVDSVPAHVDFVAKAMPLPLLDDYPVVVEAGERIGPVQFVAFQVDYEMALFKRLVKRLDLSVFYCNVDEFSLIP